MYQLQNDKLDNKLVSVFYFKYGQSIPLDPANTDYAAFKTYLSTPNASLQDATGTAMTAQQIATFLGTLP